MGTEMGRTRLLASLLVFATIAGPLAWACPCPSPSAAHEHGCCAQEGPAFAPQPSCCRSLPAPPVSSQTTVVDAPSPGLGHVPAIGVVLSVRSVVGTAPAIPASPPAILRI